MDAANSRPDTISLWASYRQNRDALSRDQLIERYLPLVRFLVAGVRNPLPVILDSEDLVGVAVLGLIDAIERFDPERGVKFETFAGRRVRGAIVDHLRCLDWLPRTTRRHLKSVHRGLTELQNKLNRHPSDDELAKHLGL